MNELFKIALTADVGGFVSGMSQAEGATQKVGAALKGLGNVGRAGSQAIGDIASMARTSAQHLRNWGLGGIAAVSSWTLAASSFQTQMLNANALINLNGKDFQKMSDMVLNMSAKMPQGLNEAAAGFYQIISAGYSDPAQAATILAASESAASAGMADTSTAATALTGALHAYGQGADQAAHFSDILFQEVNLGVNTFSDLAQGMGMWVNIAASAKVPLVDAAAALATITRAGVVPAEASTSLERLLTSFIKPSSALTGFAKTMGYETPLMMVQALGLAGTMDKIRIATGGSATSMLDLFKDIRGARGALALVSADGANYVDVQTRMSDASQLNGATQRALAIQSKGLGYQFNVMKNEIQRAAVVMGQPLLGPTTEFFRIIGSGAQILGSIPAPIAAVISNVVQLGSVVAAAAGFFAVWQLKSFLLGGAFKFLGGQLIAMSGSGFISRIPFLSSALASLGNAAKDAGGSFLRLGANLINGFLTKIPIIGPMIQKLATSLHLLALGATVAIAAFAGFELLQATMHNITSSGDSFWASWNQTQHFDNLQHVQDSLAATTDKINAIKDASRDQSTIGGFGMALAATLDSIPGVGSAVGGITGLFGVDLHGQTERIGAMRQSNAELDAQNTLLSQMQNLGGNVSRDVYDQLWKSNVKLGPALKFTNEQVAAFADQQGIKLFTEDPKTHIWTQDAQAYQQVIAQLTSDYKKLGGLPPPGGDPAAWAAQIGEQSKAAIKFVDDVKKSFSQNDIFSQFDNKFFESKFTSTNKKAGTFKGQLKNAFSFDELKQYYDKAIGDTSGFITNINTLINRGFDPNFISRALVAGPTVAGDLIARIAADTSGQFDRLISGSEARLSQLAVYAVSMAALVNSASQPGTALAKQQELPTAQRIRQVQLANPQISAANLAKMAGISEDQLRKVAQDYGFSADIPVHVNTLTDGNTQNVKKNAEDFMTYAEAQFKNVGKTKNFIATIEAGIDPKFRGQPANVATGSTYQQGGVTHVAGPGAFDASGKRFQAPGGDSLNRNLTPEGKRGAIAFNMDALPVLDEKTIRASIEQKLKEMHINTTPAQLDILVNAVYKDEVAKNVLVGGNFNKPEIKNFIIGLKGDADSHKKILELQNQMKLTPAELFTAFSVTQDKPGMIQVLDFIARVHGLRAQDIIVSIDKNNKPHFFKDVSDMIHGIHELGATTAAPVVDANTHDFVTKVDSLKATLAALKLQRNNMPITASKDGVDAVIAGVQAEINALVGQTYTVRLAASSPQSLAPLGQTSIINFGTPSPVTRGRNPSDGGFLKFADGGKHGLNKEIHRAEIAPAGTWRLWAEPETGGEAYIPLASSKRVRSTQILGDVARHFGMKVERYSDGGQAPFSMKTLNADAKKIGSTVVKYADGGYSNIIGDEQLQQNLIKWYQASKVRGSLTGNREAFYAAVAVGEPPTPSTGKNAVADNKKAMDAYNDRIQKAMDAAQQIVAQTYADVAKAAGVGAADSLVASGLTGQALQNAAQKIMQEAQTLATDKTKYQMGKVSNKNMMDELTFRLAGLKRFSAEWMTSWQELQDFTEKSAKDKFDARKMGRDEYEQFLRNRLKMYVIFSEQWNKIHSELQNMTDQDKQQTESNQDLQFKLGDIGLGAYVAELNKRLLDLKAAQGDWLKIADQIKTIKDGIAAPFTSSLDISNFKGGRSFGGGISWTDIKNSYIENGKSDQKFLDDLAQLKKAGLNSDMLKSLLATGPSALPTVQAILSAGAEGVSFLNKQVGINQSFGDQAWFIANSITPTVKTHAGVPIPGGNAAAQAANERSFSSAAQNIKNISLSIGAITLGDIGPSMGVVEVKDMINSSVHSAFVELEKHLSVGATGSAI